MAWDASTITDAAPWAALSTKIKAMCGGAGVENWEFIENVPAGTGAGQSGAAAFSVDVFRCNGTNSKVATVSNVNKLNAFDTNAGSATSIVFAGVAALSASKVYTVTIVNTKVTATDDPSSVTLDGANAPTFTKITSKRGGDATGIIQVTVWMGASSGSAPTGTNLTVAFPAVPTGVIAILDEWTGLDETLAWDGIDATGTTKGIIQSATSSGTNQGTAIGPTLGVLLSTKSVVFQALCNTAGGATLTQPPGWIATAAVVQGATPSSAGRCALKPDNQEVTGTWNQTVSTSWAIIELELQGKIETTAYSSLNDAGNDFYFCLQIPVPDGSVTSAFGTMESYNSGYKLFSRPASSVTTNTPVGTGYWRTYGFFSFNTSPINANTPAVIALATGGFNYWIKMTNNTLVVALKVGVNVATFGDMILDSLVQGPTDFLPLIQLFWNSASTTATVFTNLPGVTNIQGLSTTWQVSSVAWTEPTATGKTSNVSNNVDLWGNNLVYASRICVIHSAGLGVNACYTTGLIRGLMKQDYLMIAGGGTVNAGDTMTIDGNTWTAISTSGFFGSSTGGQSMVLLTRAI